MILRAGGAIFISTETRRLCLFLRSHLVNKPLTWAFVGGKIEKNEGVIDGISREIREEMGFIPPYKKVYPIDTFVSEDANFEFVTVAVVVEKEFIPNLNHENAGWGWFNIDSLPKPLHTGAKLTLMHKDFRRIYKEIISENS